MKQERVGARVVTASVRVRRESCWCRFSLDVVVAVRVMGVEWVDVQQALGGVYFEGVVIEQLALQLFGCHIVLVCDAGRISAEKRYGRLTAHGLWRGCSGSSSSVHSDG